MIGGNVVTPQARELALMHLQEMYPDLSDGAGRVFIDDIARHLEADRPSSAMLEARTVLDLTGAYRLLAALSVQTDEDKLADIHARFAREIP